MSYGFGFGFPKTRPFAGGPTLNFQFAGSTTLDPRITFTRASTATFFNSSGVLTSAGNNVPRLDYDPATLAARGLRIEEQRTNSIRNNTMQGAVAGTPGTLPTNWFRDSSTTGLSSTIVGTGTDGGITYLDVRIFGTAAAANYYSVSFEGAAQVVAASGETWTHSVYLKLAGGNTSGLNLLPAVGMNENTSAGVYVTGGNGAGVTPTATWQRVALTRTLNGGATVARVFPYVIFTVNNGAAINITLRIGLPQLELGAFATSVIPTTTTALTRSADVASVNTLNPWFNATAGTLFAQGILVGGTAATFPYQTALVGSNANNDSIGIQWTANTGVMRFGIRTGAVNQADISGAATKSANSSFKVAGRYATNDAQASFDGTLGTPDTTVTLPTITALSLGGAAGFQPGASVWLQRVTFYPRGLSNAELQAITA